jgi:hypothetical protein
VDASSLVLPCRSSVMMDGQATNQTRGKLANINLSQRLRSGQALRRALNTFFSRSKRSP